MNESLCEISAIAQWLWLRPVLRTLTWLRQVSLRRNH
jgi:hypothetical protein